MGISSLRENLSPTYPIVLANNSVKNKENGLCMHYMYCWPLVVTILVDRPTTQNFILILSCVIIMFISVIKLPLGVVHFWVQISQFFQGKHLGGWVVRYKVPERIINRDKTCPLRNQFIFVKLRLRCKIVVPNDSKWQ